MNLYHLILPPAAISGALLSTEVARRLAPRLGAMDHPKPLSIHCRPTARTGRLAAAAEPLPSGIIRGSDSRVTRLL
jgi:hypothetical protein